MEMQIDTLDGIHANQHIPQIVGCMELYERTGDARYRAVAEHFWRIAAGSHAYSIGGVGEGEMFRRAGSTAAFLTERTAETCASYNMLKLTSRLYPYTMEPCMMDYYERTLYNHIAASHDQSGPTGGSTYFMPLQPGARKRFSTTENTCCHGTGLENHLKYQECVYWRAEGALYVSLFIPSTLRWDDMGIRIAQRGDYAADGIATFSISGSARFALNLRLPGWMGLAGAGAEAGTGAGAGTGTGTGAGAGTVTIAASGAVTGAGAGARARLIVNGREERFAVINGYGSLTRDFRDGDIIEWHTPLTTRFEPAPDDGSIGSFFRGPLVLAAQSAETGFLRFGGAMPRPVPSEGPLAFRACGHAMLPAHMCGEEPFHIYVKR
jgi:DUF1680 family protein